MRYKLLKEWIQNGSANTNDIMTAIQEAVVCKNQNNGNFEVKNNSEAMTNNLHSCSNHTSQTELATTLTRALLRLALEQDTHRNAPDGESNVLYSEGSYSLRL